MRPESPGKTVVYRFGSSSFDPRPGLPYTLRVVVWNDNGTDTIDVYADGTKQLSITDSVSAIPYGGVAFGGDDPQFDNAKIGYDNNADDDIDDAGDDVVIYETFSSTSRSFSHDHAGNLVADVEFIYVYDAWNRLVKARARRESSVTIQTAEFDGTGRRMKKVVTNSGDFDDIVVYLYDGQKIIETRDNSENLVKQFIHGTQYIDELVMVRLVDAGDTVNAKGDLYVHQDANWNVIGLTDLGGHLVERYTYTPYGEITVHQETGYGDYDGDGDVDATDKGTPGSTCTGTVTGACRILDLDFDGDYDNDDAGDFDNLPQGLARHPGRIATSVHQPFGHQGLLFEPEIGSYQNRARQYDPAKRRFVQRPPLELFPQRPLGLRRDPRRVGELCAFLHQIEARLIDRGMPPSSSVQELSRLLRCELVASDMYGGWVSPYLYTLNSPINLRDPSGLPIDESPVDVWTAVHCAVGAIIGHITNCPHACMEGALYELHEWYWWPGWKESKPNIAVDIAAVCVCCFLLA